MPIEIIDLTSSPDSPPSTPVSLSNLPTILNFAPVSTNPNLHHQIHPHQHQTTLFVPPPPGFETPQIATGWPQPGMYHSQIATVLKPLPESKTSQFANGARLGVSWSQLEHDLFLMGLIEYGKGKWSKIAKNYVSSKTRQQVKSYGLSFFMYLPATFVHGFRKRKQIANPSNSAYKRNRNSSSAPYYGEEASGSNTNNYEAITSMTLPSASDDGGVDLELRLGLSK